MAAAALAAAVDADLPARWLLTGAIDDPRTGYGVTLWRKAACWYAGGRRAPTVALRACESGTENEALESGRQARLPRTRPAAVCLVTIGPVGGHGGVGPTQEASICQSTSGIRGAMTVSRRSPAVSGAESVGGAAARRTRLRHRRRPDSKKLRAASGIRPTENRTDEATPGDDGQSAALLVDAHGTLTLVRSARDGRHDFDLAAARRCRAGSSPTSTPTGGCAAGAIALDDHEIVYWSSSHLARGDALERVDGRVALGRRPRVQTASSICSRSARTACSQ